jgi:cytochrome c oxidase subunit I+III
MSAIPQPAPDAPARRAEPLDAAGLPEVTFGPRSVMWWGTLCFILIEGTTLGVCLGSYLFLSGVARQWPPPRTELPGLLVPALLSAALLANCWPAWRAQRAAKEFRFGEMRRWVTIGALGGLVALGLQALEFRTVGTRWDSHAYGSAVWLVLVGYALVLVTDVGDTIVMAAILWRGKVRKTHFADVEDNSFYWFFAAAMGVVVTAVVTLVPRL